MSTLPRLASGRRLIEKMAYVRKTVSLLISYRTRCAGTEALNRRETCRATPDTNWRSNSGL
jgi:hypothetical protein